MKNIPLPAELFVENRRRLVERLPPNSLVMLHSNDVMPTNADGTMGFHQNADLFYLSGINQEESILMLAPNAFDEKLREVLFLREPNELLTIWEGHKLSKEQAQKISGITTIKWLSEFRSVWHGLMCEADHVFLNDNEHPRSVVEVETRDARFVRECQARYPLHQYHRLARLMHPLRAVKSAAEMDIIRDACQITKAGFLRVLQFVRPGVNETEVEAEFAHEFLRRKACFAYPPIIASGANNCILHYNQNDQLCVSGQLLLLDVAAGYGQYMSDLTRTIPVDGRFTARQKQVYNALLRVFRRIMSEMVPGVLTRDLRKNTEKYIAEECVTLGLLKSEDLKEQDPDKLAVKKYFMHGVSHPLGLDVHDVGLTWQPVQAGWVLTCEPGIYIKDEGFGIRLENDVLVTESGPIDLMADIPIEADDIERLMADMFEVFDHTADLGIRVQAATLDELFREAARGLFSVIVEDLAGVRAMESHSIRISGEDREYLLFDWLTELLFLFETRRLLLCEFDLQLDGNGLAAECRGEAIDPHRHRLEHEIKAITYHGLKIEPIHSGWQAEMIVDI